MENPYYLKEWSQKEIEDMIAKAVKPLQEQIDVLERENERLSKSIVKNWNEIQAKFQSMWKYIPY